MFLTKPEPLRRPGQWARQWDTWGRAWLSLPWTVLGAPGGDPPPPRRASPGESWATLRGRKGFPKAEERREEAEKRGQPRSQDIGDCGTGLAPTPCEDCTYFLTTGPMVGRDRCLTQMWFIPRFKMTNQMVLAKRQTDDLCLIRKPRSYTPFVCRGHSLYTAPTSMLGTRSALDKCLWNG